ncbi:hypothetical protein PR202_ga13751 [Eleusine coracana subsp. coracana]|uniref:Uncharacterized protein n=1 Tax=Eleusine coracana subsp. coracana TaxID=191504 RepID=A0AAV5CEV8_ELECO|nr:hypothetical protein PR202_ga13751 [Eleusine coracana subsp. coracana]
MIWTPHRASSGRVGHWFCDAVSMNPSSSHGKRLSSKIVTFGNQSNRSMASPRTMGYEEEIAAMSDVQKAWIHELLAELLGEMKETTSLIRSVSASLTSAASTTSAPPRVSSASISIAKEPTQAAAALSSLDIEHSHIDVNASANCSTKCLSIALDAMVLAEVGGGVKEVVHIPTRATAMPTVIMAVSSYTNTNPPTKCSTPGFTQDDGALLGIHAEMDYHDTPIIELNAITCTSSCNTTSRSSSTLLQAYSTSTTDKDPSLDYVVAAATSLAIDVDGKEAPTTCLTNVLNLDINITTPILVANVAPEVVLDPSLIVDASTTTAAVSSNINIDSSNIDQREHK